MKWHKKVIISKIISLLMCTLLTTIFVFLFILGFNDSDISGIIFFSLILLFILVITFFNCKQLIEAIMNQSSASKVNLLNELADIRQYGSPSELSIAFSQQKKNMLYEDDKIIVTDSFIAQKDNNTILYIDGILDVACHIHKVNGIIDYINLLLLYYDGRCYTIKYKRPWGGSNMKEKAQTVNLAANIIAKKSKNFRKYSTYRL